MKKEEAVNRSQMKGIIVPEEKFYPELEQNNNLLIIRDRDKLIEISKLVLEKNGYDVRSVRIDGIKYYDYPQFSERERKAIEKRKV